MHRGPWLELLGFCPSIDQFNGVYWKWLRSFAPPTSPSGGWRRLPSLFGMPIFLSVAVSSHNLVPRAGTKGMQWEYYTFVCTIKAVNSYCVIWLASIFFSPYPHSPYGLHARTQAPYELIAFSFLILYPSKIKSTFLERLISYLISKQARLNAFNLTLFSRS